MHSLSFDTLTFDHPAASRPARITASLHLPAENHLPAPCMVILTSSAGVQRHREHYYAQALNEAGIAALVVDSFTGRGVRRTVADQTLVSAAQMEGDAFAALALLRDDSRIGPERIGVMGVSKGGGAVLSSRRCTSAERWGEQTTVTRSPTLAGTSAVLVTTLHACGPRRGEISWGGRAGAGGREALWRARHAQAADWRQTGCRCAWMHTTSPRTSMQCSNVAHSFLNTHPASDSALATCCPRSQRGLPPTHLKVHCCP